MEKFLNIRSTVEFQDTLDFHENFSIYNKKVKEIKDISKDILKFIEWDIQVLRLNTNKLHTTMSDAEKSRFYINEGFEEERNEFYELMIKESSLDVLKFRYLDYLIEFGSKVKKYEYSKEIIPISKSIIKKQNDNMIEIIDVICRMVDITSKFSMKKELVETINLIHEIILNLKVQGKYRWCLELAQLIRFAGYKKREKFIKIEVVKDIITTLIHAKEHYKKEQNLSLIRSFINELINWFKVEKEEDEIILSLILELSQAYENEAIYQGGRIEKSSQVEAHFLEYALQLYLDFGFSEEAKQVQVRIKNAYKKFADSEMKGNPFSFEIETEKLEQHYNMYKGHSISESLKNLSYSKYNIPVIEEIREASGKLSYKSVFIQLANIAKISKDRKIFETKSEEDHETYELYNHYSLSLIVNFSLFYDYVWEKLKLEGLTLEMLKERIILWDYFDEDTKIIVERGIDHYWNKDYISALHILVPQFENAFRQFFHYGDNPTTVIRKGTAQQEQTFNQFLEQEFVKKNMDPNYLFMVKFVLVDELGFNLRNDIAHGLAGLSSFRKDFAHIIIYLYFILTIYSWNVTSPLDMPKVEL